MDESPEIIRLNIAHYERLLKTALDDAERGQVTRLLEEARRQLERAARRARTDRDG